MRHFANISTPWGIVTVHERAGMLCGVRFSSAPLRDDEMLVEASAIPVLEHAQRWLKEYVHGYVGFLPTLDDKCGSKFQRTVWAEAALVPWGRVITYGELAQRVALKTGTKPCAQAIGQAMKRNPWAIMIPCHRIIASRGKLGGYAFGASTKASLLLHEGVEDLRIAGEIK